MTRVASLLGFVLLLLGAFWLGRETTHGVAALWEHWWCPLPFALIVLGSASWAVARRQRRSA